MLDHVVLTVFDKGAQTFFCLSTIFIKQGTKIFQYCTCPAGQVTYNFHSFHSQILR